MAVIGGLLAFGIAQTVVENKVEWSQSVTQIDSAEKLDAFVAEAQGQPVLVDFYATWCPPCRAMSPNVNTIALEGSRVAVVDIDLAPDLAERHQVESVPTLLIFREGKVVRMEVGYHSTDELRALLKG
ncbi:MAG: thioredoxin family protein [Candidatus Hydrogenedentes bacterium]|nr:thioredoxin family protein [Candidatus Hydrogenedentota bacterium]